MNKTKISPFVSLQYRDFRLLYLGVLLTRIGVEMQVVAVNWQVYLLTGSAAALGIIGLSRFLPIFTLSLFGGMAADVASRKKIIVASQLIMAAAALVLTITSLKGTISPLMIYLMIALNSATSAFETPARQSLVPQIVPKKHFMNAVGMTTIVWQAAVVIGPSIAGFMIGFLGVSSVYILNIFLFLLAIISIIYVHMPEKKEGKETSFDLKSLKEGISFVKNTPLIYGAMFLDFFATFFSTAYVILPIFAKDILHVGPQGLGLLYAAPSIGAITAGVITSSLKKISNQGRLLFAAICFYGLGSILFGLSKSFYLSMIFLGMMGAGDVVSTIIRNTIRQLATPNRLRGRMVSINMIFFMGGPQLGEAEAGFLAAIAGAPLSVVIGGIGTILVTLTIAKFVPKLRKYQGNELITS